MTTHGTQRYGAAEPIAIVGVGCRLAGDVSTPTDLWTFLLERRSAVRQVPAERWEPYLRRDPRNAAVLRATTPWGTFLDDLAGFDAEFFGVAPREAELMDPQQRLTLEVCWEALEHAGIAPRSLAGSDTAVLMGVNADDYGKLLMEDLPGIEAWTGIGTALCGVANRVSHLLDLRGPSVALDAACAASLVAVHQACQQLRTGETSLALAGGVSALIGPGLTRVLDQAGATAPDGRSKTFDMAADGYGRGEGAAVVVLKRLTDATRDGNRVLAVVRGGAVAHDGNTVGIMSPNGAAQADLFRLACESADIEPTSVGFIEAHGTGTPVGDRVELGALAAVYGAGRPPDAPCLIGSVKPNTGHLEGGAGVVGLIKAALALDRETIPPTAGISKLTTAVNWADSGLRVATEVEAWPRQGGPRRAAVCSYGYGGTIAHIVLEEAPLQLAAHLRPAAEQTAAPVVVPVSARSQARLARQADALAGHLRARDRSVEQVAATLWTRRSPERVRAAVLADSCEELVAGLDALANDMQQPAVVTGAVVPGASGGAVWVFSGHGSQWEGMGSELLASEPAFAAVIDEIDPVFRTELGFSAREALSTGELGTTDRVQALTFAIQAGLSAVLRDRGVTPAAVIGHSVGEVAACVAAGVLDVVQGAKVACYRARGFRRVAGHGAMALVGLSFEEAQRRLCQRDDVVAAISATPESTVVSGTADAIDEICRRCSDDGISARRVNTDVAFHSPQMDALTDDLARLTAGLQPADEPSVPLYTTALADPRSTAPRDSSYWVANLRGQVRFAEAVVAAAQDGHRLFLEISAHPVVSHSVAETLSHVGFDEYGVVPTLRRQQPELRAITHALASLYCHGAPFPHGVTADSPWADDLPGTQWQHQHFWRTPTPPPAAGGIHDADTHTLLGGRLDVTSAVPTRMWLTRLDMSNRPYPGDHPVQGTEIVPAAVLLNTMLTAATTDLVDVRLRTPVAPGRTRDLQVVLQEHCLSLSSRILDSDGAPTEGGWLTHCTAVAEISAEAGSPAFEMPAVQQRCTEELPSAHVTDVLESLGVAAMGFDWEILELRSGDGELLARVNAEPDGSVPPSWAGLLDAATSTASVLFNNPGRLKMPARIERVAVHGPPCGEALLHVRRRGQEAITDVVITDLTGTVLVSMTGLAFEDLERSTERELSRLVHRLAWHPTPWSENDRPAHVTLIGGAEATREWCTRDLAAAGVPTRSVADQTELPCGDGLDAGAVVLVLTEPRDEPSVSIDVVLRTLKHLVGQHSKARLWVLTRNVYEGTDIEQSPLWGLSRVAAAEQPQVWGGVLDLSEDLSEPLPVPALSSLTGHGVVVVRDGIAYTARLAPAPCVGEPMHCSPGGTYLITGGTGALGRQMAHRLVDLGARRLVLVSRSGMPDRAPADAVTSPELVQTVRSLEERGVFVRVAAIDVGAPGAAAALQLALRDLPPVLGVVHAAGIETGALLTDTTLAQVNASMHAKVTGARVLDEVFPPGTLNWMLLFSSCGYLTGFPGQGAYACGNAFLDAFARQRRNLGDRTISIAWTAWRGLGMGSTSEYVAAQLESMGMETISADDAMWALDLAMRDDQANAVVLPVTPLAASVPMLADIAPIESEVAESPDPLQAGLPEDPAQASDWVTERVRVAIAGQLGLPEDGVDPHLPLIEMGVDSIMTVAVRRRLEKQIGLTLSPTLLWEHPTAAAVTKKILELLT